MNTWLLRWEIFITLAIGAFNASLMIRWFFIKITISAEFIELEAFDICVTFFVGEPILVSSVYLAAYSASIWLYTGMGPSVVYETCLEFENFIAILKFTRISFLWQHNSFNFLFDRWSWLNLMGLDWGGGGWYSCLIVFLIWCSIALFAALSA